MVVRLSSFPLRYVALAFQLGAELGVEPRELAKSAGIPLSSLRRPVASLSFEQFAQVIDLLRNRTGRSDLGFELGRRITFGLHGTLGYALEHCRTVDHALRLCSRYFAIITPASILAYRRTRAIATVRYYPTVAMPRTALTTLSEMEAVSFHLLMSSAASAAPPPYEISLPMRRPAHAARYQELLPARVRFVADALPEVRIRIPSKYMDTPLRSGDPALVAGLESRLERTLPRPRATESYGEWARMMLTEAESCQPTLEELADLLRMPPHTLARRLAAEGRGFRELSNEVRMARARELLRRTSEPVARIAGRLGYGHLSNFTSAFRAHCGASPSEYRAGS